MKITFIRHSISEYNEQHLLSGGLVDSPLSKAGIELIKDLQAKGTYPEGPDAYYSSSLSRTRDTLQLAYPDAKIIQTSKLDEFRFGEPEFIKDPDVLHQYYKDNNYPGFWVDMDYRFKDGESIRDLQARIKRDFSSLYTEFEEKGYKYVAICSHGGYLRNMFLSFKNSLPELSDTFLNGKGLTCEVTRKDGSLFFDVLGYVGGPDFESVVYPRYK